MKLSELSLADLDVLLKELNKDVTNISQSIFENIPHWFVETHNKIYLVEEEIKSRVEKIDFGIPLDDL